MSTQTVVSEANSAGEREISKTQLWAGRVISGLAVAFLVMDGVMKLFKPAFVVKATLDLGYPEFTIVGIGVLLLLCTLLYVIPRTSILGAILLTGYFGGAMATHVRVAQSWFNVFFALLFGCLAWAGLWLRNPRVRSLLSFQRT